MTAAVGEQPPPPEVASPSVFGPAMLVRYLEVVGEPDKWGNRWQYNSRSDRHSKVGCWGIALDLLMTSTALWRHVASRKVVLGVNRTMVDFATGRKKKLDLVIARPAGDIGTAAPTFASLADQYRINLTVAEQNALDSLPTFAIAPVGATLVALEAKACMTAHIKSLPRLHDELNSSHLCVHGASRQALAIGYVQVNASTEFISSVTNNYPLDRVEPRVTRHRQPHDTLRVLEKVSEIPRRSASSEVGFDGIGISVLNFRNDGGPVRVDASPPAPQPGDSFHYDSMIIRMANEYDTVFGYI